MNTAQENLTAYFEKAADKVKQDADWFENNYFVPWRDQAILFSKENPITFTFISIFTVLSALPVASFIGFSVLTLSFLVFSALFCAISISTIIIFSAGTVLFFVLLLQVVIAACLTTSAIALFVLWRLVFHLRDPAGKGVAGWTSETRDSIQATWPHEAKTAPLTNGGTSGVARYEQQPVT